MRNAFLPPLGLALLLFGGAALGQTIGQAAGQSSAEILRPTSCFVDSGAQIVFENVVETELDLSQIPPACEGWVEIGYVLQGTAGQFLEVETWSYDFDVYIQVSDSFGIPLEDFEYYDDFFEYEDGVLETWSLGEGILPYTGLYDVIVGIDLEFSDPSGVLFLEWFSSGLEPAGQTSGGILRPTACYDDVDARVIYGNLIEAEIDLTQVPQECDGWYEVSYLLQGNAGQFIELEVWSFDFEVFLNVADGEGEWLESFEYYDDFADHRDNTRETWSVGEGILPYSGIYQVVVGIELSSSAPSGRFMLEWYYADPTISEALPIGGVSSMQSWVQQNPEFGTVSLSAGFLPDPHVVALQASGPGNARDLLADACVGFITHAPSVRLNYAASDLFPLIVSVDSDADTTLIVRGPDGSWYCDDDGGSGFNPSLYFTAPTSGNYEIWVGQYGTSANAPASLHISEVQSQ